MIYRRQSTKLLKDVYNSLSIIQIGFRNEDFKKMDILDADDILWFQDRERIKRDIV